MAAILGKKLGMTQVFREDGTVVPVTVIEAGPCKVTAVREAERDGYAAVQLAFGEVKEGKLTRAELGHLEKAGAPPMRHLVEFRDEDLGAEEGPKIGDDVTVASFEAGQKVKVSGDLDRQGLPGRHQAPQLQPRAGQPRLSQRAGAGLDRRQRLPRAASSRGCGCRARWATSAITQRGLEVADVDAERNLLLIKGSVPGLAQRGGRGEDRWLTPKQPCSARRPKPTCPRSSSASPSTSRSFTRRRAPTWPRAAAAPPRP